MFFEDFIEDISIQSEEIRNNVSMKKKFSAKVIEMESCASFAF